MESRHVASRLLLCCFASLAILSGSIAWAQSLTGIISGTVTDPTKAPVAGADVTLTNADTNVKVWTGKTNESGVYRAPDLPVGQYNLAVQASGFKHEQISNITLAVDQRADIDVTMQLGAVAETVTVEGSAAGQLATETASLGNINTPSQLQDMPLPSRPFSTFRF